MRLAEERTIKLKKSNNRINLTILYAVSLRYTPYEMASYAGRYVSKDQIELCQIS